MSYTIWGWSDGLFFDLARARPLTGCTVAMALDGAYIRTFRAGFSGTAVRLQKRYNANRY